MADDIERWEPFVRGTLPDMTAEEIARRTGFPVEQARQYLAERHAETVWVNNLYQVNLHPCAQHAGFPAMIHVSIKRLDKAAVRDWRHFQRIKNELVGAECEAVELYPAESRLVDGANQYHLWCIAEPGVKFPLGFDDGRHVNDIGPIGGAQRPGGYGSKP